MSNAEYKVAGDRKVAGASKGETVPLEGFTLDQIRALVAAGHIALDVPEPDKRTDLERAVDEGVAEVRKTRKTSPKEGPVAEPGTNEGQ